MGARNIKIILILLFFSLLLVIGGIVIGEKKDNVSLDQKNPVTKNPAISALVGMPDPSAVNCVKMGYQYKIKVEKDGAQKGLCIFPDGSECTAWDFYRGLCNQKLSYCVREGYGIKPSEKYEGWIEGAKCIKSGKLAGEGEIVGTTYQLFSLIKQEGSQVKK